MDKDKQIEEMAKAVKIAHDEQRYLTSDRSINEIAKYLYNAGYRKAEDVALETADDFQRRIRHIFLDMCGGNDYNTVNLLQIDSAIEAFFDSFVAELKKKHIGEDTNVLTNTEDGE